MKATPPGGFGGTLHEVATLPAGWRRVPLELICEPDRRVPATSDPRADRRYLGLEDVESDTGRILSDNSAAGHETGRGTTFAFDSRHVLYGKLRPYLNKVALPDFAGQCTTELVPLLPRDGVDREFLAWVLRRPATVDAAMRERTGSRMPRAQLNDLLKLLVPLPPPDEQVRLVNELRIAMPMADRVRAAAAGQMAAATSLTAAILRRVFEGDTLRSAPKRRLGSLTETCSGATPSRGRKDYYDGTIPWVKTGELVDAMISDADEHVSEIALRKTSLKLLPVGTVLIAMYGQGQTRGRTGVLGITATTNQACFAILPNPSLMDSLFIQSWFRYRYERLRMETEARGGNQPNLSGDLLRNEEIPVLPLLEQQRIATELSEELGAVQLLRIKLDAQLELANQLPAVVLSTAFAGAA